MLLTILWASAFAATDCSSVPPEGFVLAVGYGQGAPESALRQAREDARSRLLAQVCSGIAEARCAGIARHVRDWTTGEPADGKACATAAVRREHVESLERSHAQFAKATDALAAAIGRASGDAAVALAPLRWAGRGCTAGELGEPVAARLRNALVGHARLVAEADHVVQLELAEAGVAVAVTATLAGNGLPGFDVPLDVLGIDSLPANPCNAPGARPLAATGTVLVDGSPREETHWIGACSGDELDGVHVAAQELSSADERARVTSMVETYRGEAGALCRSYERFEIDSATYARRTEELAAWAREAQARILTGEGIGQPDRATELSLEVRPVRASGSPLATGDVVREGDTFELRARPSHDSHVYVVYENSAGESSVIPESGRATFVAAGEWAELPQAGFEFIVDAQSGRSEVVYVLATPAPVDLAVLQPAAMNRRFKARGLGVQAKSLSQSAGATFYGDPEQVVKGYGGVLYTLVLDHQ